MSITVLKATDYRDKDRNGDYFDVHAVDTRLTKVIDRHGNKHNSNYPKYFELGENRDFDDLASLQPFLEELGGMHDALVIRGEFKRGRPKDKVRRIAENVISAPSKVIAIDVDDVKLPVGMSRTDLKAQGEYVCNLLHHCDPLMFPDDMGFIAQGSSSAGFSDNIKLHLWLLNDKAVNQAQLRNLFYYVNTAWKNLHKSNPAFEKTNANLVDPALYHAAQAHYTAYPLFEVPSMDPFRDGGRTVYVYGNTAKIAGQYPEYVKPVKVTEMEYNTFEDSVEGSKLVSVYVERAINVVADWDKAHSGLRSKVIACFHEAVQNQFCLQELKRILRPYLDDKRPGQADEYFNQGVSSALQNIKATSVREVPSECKGLKLRNIDGGADEKYLRFSKFFPEDSVTFLKATLGTGKTNTISQWLADGTVKGNVLAITDTSALVESNAVRFDAGDFRKAEARLQFAAGSLTRLSGTLHSLPKIKDFADSFDFIFIDEADSVMNNLLFASILTEEKKQEIISVLRELLINTNRVVISDGDISQETVNCYVELMDGQRDLNKVDFRRKNLAGVQAYKHLTETSLWGAVQGHLELGDKCLVVTDSSPKKLNEYYHTFTRVCPDKKVNVVHSASKMDSEVRDIVNRTTKALEEKGVDLLLCSPSITNGVDFNYFDAVFVLTVTDNQTPNMRFQAMMRERQPETIHYFFHNKKQFTTGYKDLEFSNDFTNYARKEFSLRREREFKTYIATFNYYLIQSGASISVLDTGFESPKGPEDKEEARIERISAIARAGGSSVIERHNDAFEQRQMLRYYYDIPATEDIAWDTIGEWVDEKPHIKAEYFYKIFKIVWPYVGKADPKDVLKLLKEQGHKFYLATGESLHGGMTKAKSILTRCNISPNDPESLEKAVKYLRKYCELTPGCPLPEELVQYEEVARDV